MFIFFYNIALFCSVYLSILITSIIWDGGLTIEQLDNICNFGR